MLGLLPDEHVGEFKRVSGVLSEVVCFAGVAFDQLVSFGLGQSLLLQVLHLLSCRCRKSDQVEPRPINGTKRTRFIRMLDRSQDVRSPSKDGSFFSAALANVSHGPKRENLLALGLFTQLVSSLDVAVDPREFGRLL